MGDGGVTGVDLICNDITLPLWSEKQKSKELKTGKHITTCTLICYFKKDKKIEMKYVHVHVRSAMYNIMIIFYTFFNKKKLPLSHQK